ncbi:MAG: aminotransferase class V-fold PLP-dependent enzyme [Spirochaetes bacterium]|jgi:glutamate/tyrosine decarboxylase-like PLP-dependent enzyme|nr:aminotransferase class V-fold PLP-dependent enzyme [Spirochaetota bacterium]
MDIMEIVDEKLGKMNPAIAALVVKLARKIPYIDRKIAALAEKEYGPILDGLEDSVKPYRKRFRSIGALPVNGMKRRDILDFMKKLKNLEESRWKKGFVSGAVYHGDRGHIDFLNEAYSINSQSNPLHSDIWPSAIKYEAEIVSMTGKMLGGVTAADSSGPGKICGTVTSGGTESILLAMKTYRDRARKEKGIRRPEIVIPVTAHAAFDKAGQYFNIKIKRVPIDSSCRADIREAAKAISSNTVALVGSAPSFPHGAIDPIPELSETARKKGIGFHVDACLGGFILPWAERLGYDVPPFDFRLPGVTSISADTHKYGYAAKGTSVVLYRGEELRHYQFYKTTDWPGGLYFSPTFAGSRPGALSAACWAAMVSLGEDGYLKAAGRILKTADQIKKGIAGIPGLRILGNPLWNIAFASDELDIYRVLDFMTGLGWSLNGLHRPSCVHICVTLRHAEPGVAARFIRDLRSAVAHVKKHPSERGDMAPVYGMAATLPDRSIVSDLLDRYMDILYRV